MNLDNGPNFALAYLVPVYSLDFESAKSQGNAIFYKVSFEIKKESIDSFFPVQ